VPWPERSTVKLRDEFVYYAQEEGVNLRELCRHYQISPPTGYKWLKRYRREGAAGLVDRSRRPIRSPRRTPPSVEEAVVAARRAHPSWGGRKILAWLRRRGVLSTPRSASTITAILHRRGMLRRPNDGAQREWRRFSREAPNELWQMDFKGHFVLGIGSDVRCHPLTVLDDHSRFAIGLEACENEQADTVRARLTKLFKHFGLPREILADNGSPWRSSAPPFHISLTVWLLRLGIVVRHGRPGHPQTQGKDERFHRTLKEEVLDARAFADLDDCQREFEAWRNVYNWERPHDALNQDQPGDRYVPSDRHFPEVLPAVEYLPSDVVRYVCEDGTFELHERRVHVGSAFRGEPVAIRATPVDGLVEVFYCTQRVLQLDLRMLAREA
jgi:transposase InsO family protein